MISHQLALIKREVWEHRSIYVTPAAIAVVIALTMLTGQVSISGFDEIVDLAIVGATNADEAHRRIALTGLLAVVMSIFAFGAGIVMVFYTLDTLYAERKDKSILFWRSLPVTDAETVISKLLTAAFVIPMAFLAAVIVTHLVVLSLASIWILTKGGNAGHLIWSAAPLFDTWAAGFILALAIPLWLAPFFGWFLFVSAFSKRSPLLIAFLPIFILPMLERMLIGSHLFYDAIFVRTFKPPLASVDISVLFDDDRSFDVTTDAVSILAALDLSRFAASPSLWAGLVVCGLLTTAAIYMRRYRDDS